VLGVVVLLGMPWIASVYGRHSGSGMLGLALRGVVAGICLLPPTILMGATLPAVARWVRATREGVAWLGLFYAGNTVGAVAGCLLAGFYLLRAFDMGVATYVAGAINGIVALMAIGISSIARNGAEETSPHPSPLPEYRASAGDWTVCVVIAISGATALGAEVIWTRLLSLMLGPTVYTFSIILAVFLAGLGIGSAVGAMLSRWIARPRLALGWCQLLLVGALAWAAYALAGSLPYWPVDLKLSARAGFIFQLDLARCAFAILPAACLWGASFPLALASAARPGDDAAKMVSGIYAFNTVGAIAGALLTSLLLIQNAGTARTQQILILIAACAALLAILPTLRPAIGVAMLISVALGTTLLVQSVPPVPGLLIAFGRYLPTRPLQVKDGKVTDLEATVMYQGEGLNSPVAVTRLSNGVRNFHVSGRIEASTELIDMRLQRLMGHIPALIHSNPRSVLVVGCGAGVTAGSFLTHPEVERIVICEIEPLIPQKAAQYFAEENFGVVNGVSPKENSHMVSGKRVEIVYDDARHYLLTTADKFDIITSDPIHPWMKGSATLYTQEYFELCREHLNAGGVVTQWSPLYESSTEAVKSECATFFKVFPNGIVWGNDNHGEGYDAILTAQTEPTTIDVDQLQKRLSRPDHREVLASLRWLGFDTAIDLASMYAGQASDLTDWLRDAQINRDRNLRLQYLAGLALNARQSEEIYHEMLTYRKFPKQILTGSDRRLHVLEQALQPTQARQ
jgi:spermidine synthase